MIIGFWGGKNFTINTDVRFIFWDGFGSNDCAFHGELYLLSD